MDRDTRSCLFKNPTAQYRGKPFWAWNGRLEEQQLHDQIDWMEKMGFGGYFMHSRTGLETEYLGEEWFSLTNSCADYGERKGLESWLYDEDRWPSGIAGGMVTQKEEYRASFLKMELLTGDAARSFDWDEKVQAAFWGRTDGETITDIRKWSAGDLPAPGETLLAFRVVMAGCLDVYNGGSYLDTMNRAGTEYFLRLTHEKYREKCGPRIGTSIRGIFTDEPHRGPLFSEFSDGDNLQAPYTPQLWEEFRKRFGYDLREKLPELFLRRPGQKISKAAHDYIECCQELFLENFAQPVHDWCSKNNMIFTGHVLHEDSLTAQTVMQGSLMRFYAHMDYPGVDVLACGGGCWWIVKQVASVARQLGRQWILSELYGCTGWQMNFENYKNAGLWQALFGVNLRCPHLSWYTMKGEAKRDFPASIFYQSAWAGEYKYVEDFFSRIHVFLQGGEPECSLLVLCPVESVWGRACSGAFRGLEPVDGDIRKLEEEYVQVFEALTRARIDFDYGEESLLEEYASVEGGLLKAGFCSYTKVLAAGMDTIRSSTLRLLEELADGGGQVIFAGQVPSFVDVVPSARAQELADRTVRIPLDPEALAANCASGREVRIEGAAGRQIFAQVRRDGGERRIMLLNSSDVRRFEKVEICLGQGEFLERWEAADGQRLKPDYRVRDGLVYITEDFAPGQERLYVVTEHDGGLPCDTADAGGLSCPVPEEFAYELSEPNICVLDQVRITSDRGEKLGPMEVLKADRALRDLLGIPYRGGDMLQPWYELKTGSGGNVPLRSLNLEYRVEAACDPGEVWLVFEDPEHVQEIVINGAAVSLVPDGTWVDIGLRKYKLPRGAIREGVNYIVLRYGYCRTCGLEAVYLLGGFGVRLTDDRLGVYLTRLPQKLRIGDLRNQGLPFYSGKVRYLFPEEWTEKVMDEYAEVSVPHFEGACVKLIGETDRLIAWAPYVERVKGLKAVELVLTRRNTFGPLHQFPAVCVSYGPDNFVTEGKEWSDAYMLLPQGIMEGMRVRYPSAGFNRITSL